MPEHPPLTGDDAVPAGQGRRYVTLVVAGVALVALTCVAFLVPVPYVTMRPGPAFNTLGEIDGKPMFTFGKGVKTYPTSGALDFTTVSVGRADSPLSLGEAVSAYFTEDVSVVPRDLVYPEEESDKDARSQGAAQLSLSKDSSRVAALRAAGYTVPGRPEVIDVAKDGAAADVLEKGDLILAVDGKRTATSAEVVAAVGKVEPGDEVTLEVERGGKDSTVDITTKADPQDAGVPRVGVVLGTKWEFPVQIENNVGDQVGGPSAGSMFALAIYDRLTPGDLTAGRTVAGTGEISPEGTVGSIGGVRQKMAGAAADGATIFLVPADNCAEAADGDDHGLRLVRVKTLDDAIDSLESLAKDPDAKVPTCR